MIVDEHSPLSRLHLIAPTPSHSHPIHKLSYVLSDEVYLFIPILPDPNLCPCFLGDDSFILPFMYMTNGRIIYTCQSTNKIKRVRTIIRFYSYIAVLGECSKNIVFMPEICIQNWAIQCHSLIIIWH